jgi:hypothetical protein
MANTLWTVYVQNLTAACQLNDFTCPWQSTGQTINFNASSAGTGNAQVTFNASGTYNIIVADPAIAGFSGSAVCGGFTLVTVVIANINPSSQSAPASRAARVASYTAVPTSGWTPYSILATTDIASPLAMPVSSFIFTVAQLEGTEPLNFSTTVALWDNADSSNEWCIFPLASPDFTGPAAGGAITANMVANGCFLNPSSTYTWVFTSDSFGTTTNQATNFSFTTAADTVPPTVVNTDPAPRGTGQQEDDAITFYFSEWVDVAPNGTFTFTSVNPANGPPVVITVPSGYPDVDLPDNLIVDSVGRDSVDP